MHTKSLFSLNVFYQENYHQASPRLVFSFVILSLSSVILSLSSLGGFGGLHSHVDYDAQEITTNDNYNSISSYRCLDCDSFASWLCFSLSCVKVKTLVKPKLNGSCIPVSGFTHHTPLFTH